ncbi:type VI secretion system baseplate subunit TssK [Janthinobacterium sp. PSRC2-1]|uniref:type VI secretion system baseplate subunit TssK n=1 Tax=Janthinobacterium sp. PSRC2-1 TaxID=2804587 RepID=UPI003CED26B9
MFKDGEIYQAPLSDELPLAIDLGKLPADEQSFVFYAALPVVKTHGGNLASGEAPYDDTRYAPFDAQTLDLYTDALSTVSAANASLAHCAKSGHCHPERLFDKLMVLAGGLMAFSRKYSVSDLPAYDHESPAPGFDALNAIICELLDTVVSSRYVVIPLTFDKEQGPYHQGKIDATLLDRKAGLYLAVTANMPALNLVAEVPRQLKIASPHDIEALIRSALPGLQLVHMAQVPMEVPVRPNAYYFSIDNRGELYEAMMKAQAIAIYAPSTFTELRMELFAITD